MKPNFSILLFLIINISLYSQHRIISGIVQDANSNEKLPYASIFFNNIGKGVTANAYGFFSVSSSIDSISLTISYVGYKPVDIFIKSYKDSSLNVFLEQNNELKEVIVTGEKKGYSVKSSQFNISSISLKDLNKIPVIMGEADILKSIQLMPGVKGGAEGTSGLYVRGGSPDQNLVLLDGVPVYNANHLFGFFSVFNSDALKNITVIKGGFPARYGGRLSSIIDIQMKEGNNQKLSGDLSLGLISSKFTVEGPIIKDKTSFSISGRRTYFDLIMALLNKSASAPGEDLKSGYYFYDLNVKVNHKITENQHLYLSFYSGKDKAYLDDRISNYSSSTETNFDLFWKNTTIAFRYNYIISSKLFLNTTLTYGRYQFSINNSEISNLIDPVNKNLINQGSNSFSSNSGITDYGIKFDFDYYATTNHSIKFGLSHINHIFRPEVSSKKLTSENDQSINIDTTYGKADISAQESSVFIEDDWDLGSKFKANIGLRFSNFFVQQKNFTSIEPRLSLRYLISDNISIKWAYSRMDQYIHLLSNSSVGLPTDLWLPSTAKIKPSYSDQFAFGAQYNINSFEIIIESFYKKMFNLIEYKEGIEYLESSNSWEDKVEIGEGNAYGCEFLLQKNTGKTTGWLGYTLSWSNRKFNNINNGNYFPYKYDRRHDISVVISRKILKNADFSLTWVFSSGSPITLPIQKYASFDNPKKLNYYYSDRNSYRMPAYHRMDIGTNFYKKKKYGTRIWSISIYNVYNHLNPYYIYAKNNGGKTELFQYSLFPIMPTLTYTYKF